MDDKLRLNWDQASDLSVKLASLISSSGQQFDYMIVVPRGGYFVANIVARRLDFSLKQLMHACVGSYDSGIGQQRDELTVGDMPDVNKVKDSRILVIDEVCDTGNTLKYIADYLNQAGAHVVSNGVLHYKPSKSRQGLKPDWFVDQTDKWIVYPWEEHEPVSVM